MTVAFEEQFQKATVVTGQPIDLRPILSEPQPFPVDSLSPRLREAVNAIADLVQVPHSIAAQSVLAACALVAQTRIVVEMPTREQVPATLFLFTIAASGDRKTSCDKLALHPVYQREARLREAYEQQAAHHSIELTAYTAAFNKAKAAGGKDRQKIAADLAEVGPPPIAPPMPMLLVEEPTVEGIVKLLDEAYPSIGLFSDEGAKMLGGYSMQEERRAATGAALSQLWDGKPIKRVRAGDLTKILPGRRMSLHLMVQPGVALGLFGDKSLRDQGMMSRLLVAYPKHIRGTRFFKEPDPEKEERLRAYHSRLASLLRNNFDFMDPQTRNLEFGVAQLQPEARALWIQFNDHIERQIGPGGALEEICDLASKITQHATRLAAVLSYFENGLKVVEEGISAASMASGIALSNFYLSEALRLYNAGSVDEDSENAAALIEFIHKRELAVVGMRWMNQNAPKHIRAGRILKRAVDVLIEAGHLHPIKGGAKMEISGKAVHQREAFTVVYGGAE